MAREAVLRINCGRYSEKIIDIVYLFNEIGWGYYDVEKNVVCLPLGDKDDFDWQTMKISGRQLQELIDRKQSDSEIVGINLYYKSLHEGVILLAENTGNIELSLSINRRIIENNRQSITDIGWYFTHIVKKLAEKGVSIDYFQFEEYTN